MKNSIYVVGLVSLAISIFSANALADGVTKVYLSTTPIMHVNKHTHYAPPQKVRVLRTQNKRWVKPSNRKRVIHTHKIRTNTKYSRNNNLRNKNRAKSRNRVISTRIIKRKPLIRYHYIQSGDSLYKIAKRYKVTVKHILHINNLKTTVIKVGGRLKI